MQKPGLEVCILLLELKTSQCLLCPDLKTWKCILQCILFFQLKTWKCILVSESKAQKPILENRKTKPVARNRRFGRIGMVRHLAGLIWKKFRRHATSLVPLAQGKIAHILVAFSQGILNLFLPPPFEPKINIWTATCARAFFRE